MVRGWHNPSDQRRFLRVVRETRPQFFVLGNVRSMLNDSIYHHLLKDFEYQGYITLPPWVMNAADYGVPQDREYVFIVGHLPNAVAPIMPAPLPLIVQKQQVWYYPHLWSLVSLVCRDLITPLVSYNGLKSAVLVI